MRLIDADKVKIESRKHCINCTLNGTKQCKTCVINLICDRLDLQPTVEERPQGKWILCEDSYFSKCSICGDIWLNEECWNYCSNCGAYMRSDNNGKK